MGDQEMRGECHSELVEEWSLVQNSQISTGSI